MSAFEGLLRGVGLFVPLLYDRVTCYDIAVGKVSV